MTEQPAKPTPNAKEEAYAGVRKTEVKTLPAPQLPYLPIEPRSYRPGIGLIGCGGITGAHLAAYQKADYNVVALCDLDEIRATERRDEFYPSARVYTDYHEVLQRDDIDVVDIATHPAARKSIIEDALRAKKHVLSQKPFVLDLDDGEHLVNLAEQQGVKLAVNQNGRWAPHIAYMRLAIADGLLGDVTEASMSANFDHSWVIGTPFDAIYDLVLYDYAIHWFDMLTCYFGDKRADRVYGSVSMATGQRPKPPLLAHVVVDYSGAQATLSFNAATLYGHHDRTFLVGTKGTAHSQGPGLQDQTLEISTEAGTVQPELIGSWFENGFHGTMAELLCAIEDNRTPSHNAQENLHSLALAFAAIGSAHAGVVKRPGEVRRLPEKQQ